MNSLLTRYPRPRPDHGPASFPNPFAPRGTDEVRTATSFNISRDTKFRSTRLTPERFIG
jgi:hypothetical protein